ncbi:hypothetical protein BV898_19117 [Hypsibius exemplaris]|uniref:Uncharacterized protein n=1 Tax=Hypsibius exemplaris TaxID=2072580 RepID=A0A9X6NQ44_HYPEX|nr:hypothetical protein BV898_19117 [Hypsibius exemplaris]
MYSLPTGSSVPECADIGTASFFYRISRGRGGPSSSGAPRRATYRAPTFQTRPPAVNTYEQQQRPQPRMPLVPPARNPDVKATGISAGRLVAPPTVVATSSAVPPPQSKRYSERCGQSIRADTSDDVRSSGGWGGAGGGHGYQQNYGRGGGGGGSGSGGYAMRYPSGGATVNYGTLHPPGPVPPPVTQQQYGQYYSGGSGSGGHYYDQQQHGGGGGSHQAGYYQGGGYSGPGYYQ